MNTDSRLGDPSKRKFQFKSCSGAVTSDVLNIQIPSLDSGQNAIMLSIGKPLGIFIGVGTLLNSL